ncbi:MAG: NAD(P)/FAD-dependent oxidoreductase [Akkermansiaceae bacterium]
MPTKNIAIIGAGPAGLRAAEVAAESGASVTIFDSKPSSGRKFLVAGKSGLNLTNDEPWETFLQKYSGTDLPHQHWNKILSNFDNQALRYWAGELGIATFVASSGKVFPTEMKAAPLLKRWIDKLRALEVSFSFNHHCTNFSSSKNGVEVSFSTPDNHEETTLQFDAVVLALGGGSWRNTGSTGEWTSIFLNHNIHLTPLTAANCGWETPWPEDFIKEAEGLPLKNIIVTAGEKSIGGELVITKYGLEGGPIYKLGAAIKSLPSPQITIDFKPSHTEEQLTAKMESAKRNLIHEAKLRWKLNAATHSLLKHHFPTEESLTVEKLAHTIKKFPIPLTQPRPIDEVISSAGGVKWSELDQNLMLKKLPGIYCAGEMIDWEAPTGGYLLQACFATGTWVAKAILAQQPPLS